MGRRALPKVDPEIDLSEHLKTFDQLPQPWDAGALFGREAPLEIEVGSGKGLFITSAATARPEHDFLGIEIAKKYTRFAASRIARSKLDNARMAVGDALRIFRELLPASSVIAVHVYFPDPWWKKRHHKRRVMNEAFLRDVERVLSAGGVLHFWTDVKEYFDSSVELIGHCTSLEGPHDVPPPEALHDMDYRTHFERRTRLEGEPVYRCEFRKP